MSRLSITLERSCARDGGWSEENIIRSDGRKIRYYLHSRSDRKIERLNIEGVFHFEFNVHEKRLIIATNHRDGVEMLQMLEWITGYEDVTTPNVVEMDCHWFTLPWEWTVKSMADSDTGEVLLSY